MFDEKTVVAFQWEPMRGTGAQCGLRRECVIALNLCVYYFSGMLLEIQSDLRVEGCGGFPVL